MMHNCQIEGNGTITEQLVVQLDPDPEAVGYSTVSQPGLQHQTKEIVCYQLAEPYTTYKHPRAYLKAKQQYLNSAQPSSMKDKEARK